MPPRDSSAPGPGGCLRSLLALALLGAWTALLASSLLSPSEAGAPRLSELRSLEAARVSLARAALGAALAALRFAPLGLLAVFVFRDRAFRIARAVLVALPAFALGGAAAVAALWLRDRAAGPPGPSDLPWPMAGVVLGVLAGLAARRGVFALVLLPVKLAAAGVLALALLGALLFGSLEREPALPAPAELRTADRREVVAAFRGKDPRSIPAGETRTLTLRQQDLDRLVGWALPLVQDPQRVRASVSLADAGTVGVRASLRLPLVSRWLNAAASARVSVRQGVLSLREPRLRLGPREVPAGLMDALAPLLERGVRSERRLRPALAALREARVDPGVLTASYGRIDAPPGLVAGLVWGEGAGAALRQPVAAQVQALLDALGRAPRGDSRFAAAYQTAFDLARSRSRGGSAVEQNRAAVLALGIVLGTTRLAPLVGDVLDERQAALASRLREGTTVRGRADWTRHFSISSALTVLSAEAPGDSAGLLKEELDAGGGGSGFSFGDLLADRAGASFGEVATRDEAAAGALQARLAGGFDVDAFFPAADGLPENIPDAELRSRYGGVGGAGFRRLADDVERRVRSCAAYR
jgi:hypothetical protein